MKKLLWPLLVAVGLIGSAEASNLTNFPLQTPSTQSYGVGQPVLWGNSYWITSDPLASIPVDEQFSISKVSINQFGLYALTTNGNIYPLGNSQVAPQNNIKYVDLAVSGVNSFALSDLGCVYGWGGSLYGVSNDQQPSSIPSSALSNVVSIAAGYGHALALTKSGGVIAWGLNTSGETQVPFKAMSNIVSIAAGNRTSAALTASGEVIVWGGGNNYYGMLTIPDNAKSGIVQIAVDDHVLALKSDGTVIAWGANYQSQSTIPAGLSNVVAISAGSGSSAALTSVGQVVSWGGGGSLSPTPTYISRSDYVAAGTGYLINWAIKKYTPSSVIPYTNGFGYSTNSNSVTILGYNGSNSIVTIPSFIAGLPVTSIGDYAFANQSSISSITIPNSVTNIGFYGFKGCPNLTSVTMPDSIVNFGTGIFAFTPNVVVNGSRTLISYLSQNAGDLGFTDNAASSIWTGAAAAGYFGWIENWLLSDDSFIARLAARILAASNNYGIAVKQNQSLNFPAIPALTITPNKKYTNVVTASSGLTPVIQISGNTAVATVSNNILTLIGSGSTTITASQVGNALWNPVTASQPLIVNKGIQTLSFPAIPAQTYSVFKTLTLNATSSAKLTPITYSSDNTAVAIVSNNILLLQGKGTSAIKASQAGNVYFSPATGTQTLTVK